jgi:hypothetical protein
MDFWQIRRTLMIRIQKTAIAGLVPAIHVLVFGARELSDESTDGPLAVFVGSSSGPSTLLTARADRFFKPSKSIFQLIDLSFK